MNNLPPLSADQLMRQAADTAHFYLFRAIRSIDEAFGDGYAKAHPEVVASFMEACTGDLKTLMKAQKSENLEVILFELIAALDRRCDDAE